MISVTTNCVIAYKFRKLRNYYKGDTRYMAGESTKLALLAIMVVDI